MTFDEWRDKFAPIEGLHVPSAHRGWNARQKEIDEYEDAIQKLLAWSGLTIFPLTEWRAAVDCLLGYDPHQRQVDTLAAIIDKLHRDAELLEQLTPEGGTKS